MKKLFYGLFLCSIPCFSFAQGTITGDLMTNVNFFSRDSAIKANGNPLYDHLLSGGETWLSLRYNNNKGFTATLRGDAFQNSILLTPGQAFTGFGIGAWNVTKEFKDFRISFGYIYDQIGSGILFRSYEDRGLLIDNALVGLQLKYKLNEHITLKALSGQQKKVPTFFKSGENLYQPIIKAINVEGDYTFGNDIHITPGIGILNRTLDQSSMDIVVNNINNQALSTRFVPTYNTNAYTLYNTLNKGDFSWYAEAAFKSHEAILKNNSLQDLSGSVFYSTLGYAKKGIAINISGKRTENFVMRTSPNEILLRGMMNWQPVIARIRPQRVMSRYTPASQDISEVSLGSDVLISPNDHTSITLNYTHINTLGQNKLFREFFAEAEYRGIPKWTIEGGVQYLEYNKEVYQVVPNAGILYAFTPFTEITYKINRKKSIRTEFQYMSTKQDYGSWLFALVEYNIAPKLSFALSDMYNIAPNHEMVSKANHYYNCFVAFTKGANRFTAAYVKQVEGINCTGGVCRYEPAFSGFKIGITSSF